jgi:micrococcal nuclease
MNRFTYPVLSYRVVDGDTVAVVIDLGFGLKMDQSVRIGGIDTPEKRTRNIPEKNAGLVATCATTAWLNERFGGDDDALMVVSTALDKYGGRIIGDLFVLGYDSNEDQTLGEHLLAQGYAREYEGGKKKAWTLKTLKGMVKKGLAEWPGIELVK